MLHTHVYVYIQVYLSARVFSEEEIVPEAISDRLLSTSIYPNSSPARSRANFGYDIYLSVMTYWRISFASNCNVPSSKSCITSGGKVSTCICMCVCASVCVECTCVCACACVQIIIQLHKYIFGVHMCVVFRELIPNCIEVSPVSSASSSSQSSRCCSRVRRMNTSSNYQNQIHAVMIMKCVQV